MIRIYPDPEDPGRSVTKISFYFSDDTIAEVEAAAASGATTSDVYEPGERSGPGGVETLMEVFYSTVELEDYAMGEMQQQSAESGMLDELIFGRNEPALHHFHRTFRDALDLPSLTTTAGAE